jgi:hypothetical protein
MLALTLHLPLLGLYFVRIIAIKVSGWYEEYEERERERGGRMGGCSLVVQSSLK